jgi:glycosyltransferase involved in cell wall biosynthesis
MKVSIITSVVLKYDAIGNDIINTVQALLKNGHEVRVFSEFYTEIPIELESILFQNFKLDYLSVRNNQSKLLTTIKRFIELFIKGFRYSPRKLLNFRNNLKYMKQPDEIQEAIAYFNESEVYFFEYGSYYDLVNSIKMPVKGIKIFRYHGVTPPSLWRSKKLIETLIDGEKFTSLANYADYVLTTSSYLKEELIEKYGVDKEKIFILPCAITPEFFEKREKNRELMMKYGLEGYYTLLYVGRMSGNKRIDHLVSALAKVKREIPTVKLMLVGDNTTDPYKEEAKKALSIAKEYGVEKDVIFTGKVENLWDYYLTCDIYVTSSLHEGFCIPLIEAMACGKPVVGTNCTAIPETIGDAGLTFEPENVEDLANKIILLLKDQGLRDELAKKSIKRAEKYTLEKYHENIINYLENINRRS